MAGLCAAEACQAVGGRQLKAEWAAACGDDEETDAGSTDSASESESTSDAAEEDDATEEVAAAETTVGLVYDIGGRGDLSFNDSAAAGLDRAEAELGIAYGEASPNDDGSNRAELLQLAADANPDRDRRGLPLRR